jgi:hypothetical protein
MDGQGKHQRLALMLVAIAVMAIGILELTASAISAIGWRGRTCTAIFQMGCWTTRQETHQAAGSGPAKSDAEPKRRKYKPACNLY